MFLSLQAGRMLGSDAVHSKWYSRDSLTSSQESCMLQHVGQQVDSYPYIYMYQVSCMCTLDLASVHKIR